MHTMDSRPAPPARPKVTVPAVLARKGGERLTMVTAYDHPSARIADAAGIDIILVGDSVGNVVHGLDTTLGVTVEMMVLHAAAVTRAKPHSLIVVDMPWMSFHVSREETIHNGGRLVQEGGAEAVKVEGGRKRIDMIEALLAAEIPVMGHLGLTPQSVHAMGGFKVQGRDLEAAHGLVEDAKALEAAGVFSIVLEGIPDVVADTVTASVGVPTIGIGAGPGTDGQVLVFHDVLGLGSGRYPKFVRSYADLGDQAVAALERYAEDVRQGRFPAEAETYHMADDAAAAFLEGETKSESLLPFAY
jgi:3-methyl-2-oxobutanoate hydroxymethyltransferase